MPRLAKVRFLGFSFLNPKYGKVQNLHFKKYLTIFFQQNEFKLLRTGVAW